MIQLNDSNISYILVHLSSFKLSDLFFTKCAMNKELGTKVIVIPVNSKMKNVRLKIKPITIWMKPWLVDRTLRFMTFY